MLTLVRTITVRTPRELDAVVLQGYILAAIAAVAFLLVAAAIAHLIRFEGGARPRDPRKRRIWFWVLWGQAVMAVYLYTSVYVAASVAPNLQRRLHTAALVASAITAVTYVAVGFVASRLFPNGKLANWFTWRS